jgi:hypothetical protein
MAKPPQPRRAKKAAKRSGKAPASEPVRLVPIPADFPNYGGSRELAIVDTLIAMLFRERAALDEPKWRPSALARIERARQALVVFGSATHSKAARHELLVSALDRSAALDAPIEQRIAFARMVVGESMPHATVKEAVVREAVVTWPETKRTAERSSAVRALARALDCDSPALMTMLRQGRARLRERLKAARAARRK